MPLSDEEKKRADDLVSNLEVTSGQVLLRDKQLTPLVESIRQHLRALRALLGIERPH